MVVISISKNTDLVADNYYEQELKYQNQIDILKNSEKLGQSIQIDKGENEIIIRSSEPLETAKLNGEISFYRTSNAAKDFKVKLELDPDGTQKIYSRNLDRGLWKLKMDLSEGDKKYFVEKSIFLD